jgi:Peptidase_C39 like family
VVTLSSGSSEGSWTGPWVQPRFDIAEVIPSWNAHTPPGSLVQVELQGRTHVGFETPWYVMARWAFDDAEHERASVPGQADELGRVATDTFLASAALDAYRLRIGLNRGEGGAPGLRAVAAIASSAADTGVWPSPPRGGPIELAVPPFAQCIHAGEYPRYGGGGASWCSPASTAMLLAYWATGPDAEELAWVEPAIADPCVDHAARHTFDVAYDGCGNWAFNTAYAARYGLHAFVTRLRSLAEAELFLAAGIPLAASIKAGPGELEGFRLPQGTTGHLVVIMGVTGDGDAVVNDPAAGTNGEVRRVYDRTQFERAWLGGSGGVVYVIHPPGKELPASPGNW